MRERLVITNTAPKLGSRTRFEESQPIDLAPWWGVMFGGGVALAVWAILKETRPRSMPIVLPSTVSNFTRSMYEAAVAALPGAMPKVYAMVVAHAAYESGWGKAVAFKQANNPFNLTTISGPFVPGPDTEYDAQGNVRKITQKWAAYPDLLAGTKGYLQFIRAPRYKDAYNRLTNGDMSFIDVLSQGRYFTLPLAEYKRNYLSILARVEREIAGGA